MLAFHPIGNRRRLSLRNAIGVGMDRTTAEDAAEIFESGTEQVRADFDLHTKVDKEFDYTGEENSFGGTYVDALKSAGIRIGVVANHS